MALNAGTVQVTVLPDTTKFLGALTAGLGPVQSKLQSALGGAGGIATTALAGLATGFAVAGAAGIKMATDFEQSFTRIQALSNASAEDVARWREEVLQLAGTTAQAPKELADALFFLSSAGLKANQIMPALTVAAKASAVGLGDTADVANIVASALNAYADSGLTAKNVTDTLVAAVREGRAEPEEFASALGRILPIASAAGVSFDQVTGSLAGLSNIGLDVNEGVTAMRGLLQALIAPGSQAAEALDELGLNAQDLLTAIQTDGLLGALDLLDKSAKANTDSQAEYIGVLREVVPNVRALTGALGLTGQNLENNQKVMDNVADSAGSLGEAFRTTEEGPAQQFAHVMTDLQVILIRFGEDLLPLITTAAGVLRAALEPLAGVFKLVGDNAETFLIILGGLFIIPKIVTGLEALAGALWTVGASGESAGTGISALSTRLGAFSLAIGAVVAAGVAWLKLQNQLDEQQRISAEAISKGTHSLADYEAAQDALVRKTEESRDGFLGFFDAVRLAGEEAANGRLQAAIDQVRTKLEDMYQAELTSGNAWNDWAGALENAGSANVKQQQDLASLIDLTYEVGGGMDNATAATVRNLVAAGDLKGAQQVLLGALTGTRVRGLDPLADAHDRVAAAADNQRAAELALSSDLLGLVRDFDSLHDAQAEVERLREKGKQGTEDYRDATAAATEAQFQATGALKEWLQGLHDEGVSLQDAKERLYLMGRQAGLTKEDVSDLIREIEGLPPAINKVPKHLNIQVGITGYDQAKTQLQNLKGMLDDVNDTYTSTVVVKILRGSQETIPAHAAGGIVTRPEVALIGEAGPEAIVPLDQWNRRGGNGTQRIAGNLRMVDWRQGIATLDGEMAWEDLARSS